MTLSQEYQDKREAYLSNEISHEDFYLWVAGVIGWGWETARMGLSIEWWAKKYQEDEWLNNVSLDSFDSYYRLYVAAAGRKGISNSKSDNVCTMKAIIKHAVKDYLGD
jgi:hypothetical protein